MSLVLTFAPVEPPVAIEQLRAHLRLEVGEEDDHLQHCLDVAVAQFDGDNGELGRALTDQTWRESFGSLPGSGGAVELTLGPVKRVVKVEVYSAAGIWQEVDLSAIELFEIAGRFCVSAAHWPRPGRSRQPLRIEYQAGFGSASDVPKPIVHAILLFAAHLYKAREPVVFEGQPVEVPLSIARLVAPFKNWWR